MIDRFHEDPDVFIFLISTLAGGTGLNLTGANKVVIFGGRCSGRGRRAWIPNFVNLLIRSKLESVSFPYLCGPIVFLIII
jgi:hypothetical protein